MRLNTMVFTVTNSPWIDSRLHHPGQIGRGLFDDPVQVSEIVISHVNLHKARNTILGMLQSFAVSVPFYTVLPFYYTDIYPASSLHQGCASLSIEQSPQTLQLRRPPPKSRRRLFLLIRLHKLLLHLASLLPHHCRSLRDASLLTDTHPLEIAQKI